MDEKRRFLARFAPFSGLADDELERIAATVDVRSYPPGETVLVEHGRPATSFYVIRSGSMHVIHEGEVADVLTAGEGFGHPSLLTGFAPAFTIRAREQAECYVIPAEAALHVLGRPAGARYVASTLRKRLARTGEAVRGLPQIAGARVTALITRPPLFADADASIRSVAREMTEAQATAALVRFPSGLGIVTDADFREHVVAGRIPLDAPIRDIATAPVVAVSERTLVLDALIDMLEAGVHHLPVMDERGHVAGIASADDLMNVESHSPFALRRALAHAPDVAALTAAASQLRDLFVALVDLGASPPDIGRVLALQSDTATTRLVELAVAAHGEPPLAWSWLALGSVARRELTLASDQDNALAYAGDRSDPEADAYFARFAQFVNVGLARCGFGPDEVDIIAGNPHWRMAEGEWRTLFRECLTFPSRSHLVRAAVAFDFRHVTGGLEIADSLVPVLQRAKDYRAFVAVLGRNAISYRPPLGFRRQIAPSRRAGHAVDLKTGGITPIANLARFHALANGITISGTLPRLTAAEEAGALNAATAQALREAFVIVSNVRLGSHAAQIKAGRDPDNVVDPDELAPLVRTQLREAFRAIAAAQKQLSRVVALDV